MLIPNIMFVLHENQVLVVEISKYEPNFLHFTTDFEKIDFLEKETKLKEKRKKREL